MSFRISLGSKVRDVVTGFSGIVTGQATWLTGCDQYVVTPDGKPDDDGAVRSYPKGEWFDDNRLEVVGTAIPLPRLANASAAEDVKGGPQRDAPRPK